MKCLVYGNVPKNIALEIRPLLDIIKIEQVLVDNWKLSPMPVGIKYVDINKVTGSPNSSLVSVDVCLGVVPRKSPEYHKLYAFNVLFDNYMHSLFFETMRSRRQLGYTVKCIPRFYGKKDVCIVSTFSILSSKYNHAEMERNILGFFETMYNKLNELTTDRLREIIDSAVITVNDKPNNMTDTALDIFEQISNESYDYNYRLSIINELNNINIGTFKKMYIASYINPETRRIIIVRST
jgi:secreted Zn-dependent insulinase-like peptidase